MKELARSENKNAVATLAIISHFLLKINLKLSEMPTIHQVVLGGGGRVWYRYVYTNIYIFFKLGNAISSEVRLTADLMLPSQI